MKEDVSASLLNVTPGGEPNTLEAEFRFDPALPLFRGHFPGHPLVPGALEIEMVRHAVENHTGRLFAIERVTKAKFSGQALPGRSVTLHAVLSQDRRRIDAGAVLAQDGKEVARIALILRENEDA